MGVAPLSFIVVCLSLQSLYKFSMVRPTNPLLIISEFEMYRSYENLCRVCVYFHQQAAGKLPQLAKQSLTQGPNHSGRARDG